MVKAVGEIEIQDAEENVGRVQNGTLVLCWRAGGKGRQWWYNGEVAAAYEVQFPVGQKRVIVQAN